jgi:sirohydrochlorin ferrochelatase
LPVPCLLLTQCECSIAPDPLTTCVAVRRFQTYLRDTAIPTARTWVNETAVPAVRSGINDVLIPGAERAATYTRVVLVPNVTALGEHYVRGVPLADLSWDVPATARASDDIGERQALAPQATPVPLSTHAEDVSAV